MKKNMKHGENFQNLQYFCQMIFGKCSIKIHRPTQLILTAQEKYVLGTFFFIFLIGLLKKNQFSIGHNSIYRIWPEIKL